MTSDLRFHQDSYHIPAQGAFEYGQKAGAASNVIVPSPEIVPRSPDGQHGRCLGRHLMRLAMEEPEVDGQHRDHERDEAGPQWRRTDGLEPHELFLWARWAHLSFCG